MGKAIICGKTIAYGKQRWRVDVKGNWEVLMYGSHINDSPGAGLSWKWHHIDKKDVPKEVEKIAK